MIQKQGDVTIRFTRIEAKALGLFICECGYPENNHFDFGKRLCAHSSKCTGYKERIRYGTLVKQRNKK